MAGWGTILLYPSDGGLVEYDFQNWATEKVGWMLTRSAPFKVLILGYDQGLIREN